MEGVLGCVLKIFLVASSQDPGGESSELRAQHESAACGQLLEGQHSSGDLRQVKPAR